MAKLSSDINIKIELRPCIVKGRKALFHKWSVKSKETVAIIEYEDGAVTECYPYEIKFVDAKFKEYCF